MISTTLKPRIALFVFYAMVIAVAVFGSQFTPGEWYVGLQKSSLTPPNIVFPIVWTMLYALMPLSLWMVYLKVGMFPAFRAPRNLFFVQLALNGVWTYLFFGLHQPLYAMIDIALLWCVLIPMLMAYARISLAAAWMQVPYLLWVSFAAYLNAQIVILN